MLLYILLFIGSLAVLLKASDWFVESAEEIGLSFGVAPFIIGVTIVAFGTSLPELATSISAVVSGSSEIVVGNVIGSNIANVLLVLGLAALFVKAVPINFHKMTIDLPMLFGSSLLLWFALSDLSFSIFEIIIFLLGLFIFLRETMKKGKKEKVSVTQLDWKTWALLVIAMVLVYFGATYTIVALKKIAEMADISPHIIAVTGVALGTSLPEVMVSISAVRKGKYDIAVGNVVGSNLFNTFAVMAIPAMFGKLKIPSEVLAFELPFMVGITLLFVIISYTNRMNKWQGALLILFYIYFIGHLFTTLSI